MNPRLTVKQEAILHNLDVLKKLAERHGISISVVTKGLAGFEPLARLLTDSGADSICEARIQNLMRFRDIPAEKWLIRSPLLSEAEDTVRYADISLVSERTVLEALSAAAQKQGRIHKAVILLELGELREGCMRQDLLPLCEACINLPGINLHGIGANLSCINEIVPDESNMAELADAAAEVESRLGLKLPVVSGGSSSSVKMLAEGRLPAAINHLRIGEAILLGNIVCYDIPFAGARTDAFTLSAEIFEIKEKPAVPWGERAPGLTPVSEDPAFRSMSPASAAPRKRALIAVGKQDVYAKYLVPQDPQLKIIGDTSDCLIADITDCTAQYKLGDTVDFRLLYNGVVSAMAADTVDKVVV